MRKLLLLPALLLCAACARNMNSNVYSDSATPGKVLEGTVISARPVTIKAHDKLQDNTLGGVGGGVAGGLLGSQVGNGGGSVAGAIGGALLGAVGGALAEDALGSSDGTEYLIKLDKKYLQEYHTISKKIVSNGKNSVEQGMTSTDVPSKTDIVSVAQAPDESIRKGSRVYVIYNDDRPRVVAQ